MSRVVIVGGGITGLAAAWELQQHGILYTLLEGSNRLGGKIITERVDGFVIEGGADSFLVQKPWAWQLCREIGLENRLIGTNDAQRNVYVLHTGKLHPFPRGMRLIVPLDPDGLMESTLLSDEGKRRMLAEVDVPPRAESGDENLASFVRRRFGQEALDIFGDSLLAGIHVSNPKMLSMQAAFPNYLQLEQTAGSVIRGLQAVPSASANPDMPKTAFVSLRNGMFELIEGLQARLTGDIRLNQPVSTIRHDRSIHLANGEKLSADTVILTTPAHIASRLIGDLSPELARCLQTIRMVSSGTVSLGYRAADLAHPLDGFGFVIPRSEPTRILACTWSSTKLPYRAPQGHVLIRVFFGGHGRESDVNLPDDQLVALARAELREIMGIGEEPVISRVFRYRDANPQYDVGHLDRVTAINALCPPWLTVTGCSCNGVGIPDCVRQGREAARRIALGTPEQ
jgi:protoporphyrinogen/coproporphyrinogen III oxidase